MAAQFSEKDGRPWKSTFFTIWGGQAFSILGSQLVQFALIWYLTVQTGSATVLATASLVSMLPGVILGPFVGTLVDRWNRRWIMVIADSVVALASIILAVLFLLDIVVFWHIYIVMFIRSLAGGFHGNAMNASTSLMVPMEKLTQIQGINQMLNGGLNVVSAPLGALLLSIMPMEGVLAIDVVTALMAVLPLCFIRIPQPRLKDENNGQLAQSTSVWQDFKAGLQYLVGWPGLLMISLLTVVINFTIIPAFSLLPLMVKDFFGGDAIMLGWIESAMGIGIVLGGALLGAWGGFKRKILTSMFGLMGMGVGTLILALTPDSAIFLAIVGALFFGIMNPFTMGPFYAIIQTHVQPDMQARIFSLLFSIGAGIAPIGLMVAGPIADKFGIQTWFLVGGSLCVLMAIISLFIPAVMNIEKGNHNFVEPKNPVMEPIMATQKN
jgi:DHA3 family macrolide efflux protein-like MFS transporter